MTAPFYQIRPNPNCPKVLIRPMWWRRLLTWLHLMKDHGRAVFWIPNTNILQTHPDNVQYLKQRLEREGCEYIQLSTKLHAVKDILNDRK